MTTMASDDRNGIDFEVGDLRQPQMLRLEIPALRQEIIASEKGRFDLLQWKLVLSAALGAVGLGFSRPGPNILVPGAEHLLGLIPLVCIYVDLLLWHKNLRILVIGSFLRKAGDEYERYCVKLSGEPSSSKNW